VLTSQNFGSDVRGVAFHPTKNLVASCSNDQSIKLWNADTGAELWTVRGHSASVNCVDFSPDGLTIASGSGSTFENDNSVRVWDVKTGKQLWQLSVDGQVWSVDWSPCGNKLSAACNNFDDDSYSVKIFSKEGSTGNFVCQSTLSCDSPVKSSVWSPDGAKIVARGGDLYGKGKVWIFDSTSGALIGSPLRGEKPIKCLAFSRNGRILAAGDGFVFGGQDYSIRLYDAESGTQIGCPLNVGYAFSRFSTRIFLPARPLFSRFSTRISV